MIGDRFSVIGKQGVPTENTEGTERRNEELMKTLLEKLKSRKLLTTVGAYALGGYLISQGHVEAGTALISIAQGTYNVGQGMADAKGGSLLETVVQEVVPAVAGKN